MKKIGYENKENLRNNPNIAEKNKVTDENMNEIKEVVNYNANESENVKDALIHITTEKSSNINVKDSSDLNAKIDVFGISKQETREGYNLFNNTKTISNVTYNSEEDKWVFNLPGKYDHIATKGTFFKNIKANTNYTLYFNILKNTSSAAILFNSTNTIWNNNIQISAGQTGVVVNNIKTREDLSTALYDLWFSHLNTITGEFEAQIMLVEGTFTSENIPDYEQYGASPSPEYPSNIENVGDNINVFDISKITSGSIVINNNDGTLTIKNNPNTNGYVQQTKKLSELCPDLKVGDIATLGFKTTTKNSSYANSIYVGEAWNNGTYKTITQSMLDFQVGFYGGYNEISTISDIKIEKGTKQSSYSTYNCGNIDITVCNKNFFSVKKWKKIIQSMGYPEFLNDNNNSVEIIEQTKTSIKYNQKNIYCGVSSDYIKIKKGQAFELSFEYENINRLFITQYNEDKERIKELNSTSILGTTKFIAESDGYITIAFSYSDANLQPATIEIKNILLEVNEITGSFIEPEQQLTTFPLAEGQKLYKGDYPASDGIHHVRKQVELDGTEDWKVIYENIFYLELSDTKLFTSAIMTHFKYAKKSLTELLDNEFTTSAGQGHAFWIKKEGMTLEEFKSYLAQQKANGTPVVLEYELAEEEIEAYTEEQQEAYNKLQNVLSYKTETNVFTDKAQLVFKYIADTKTYVDNRYNALAEQILNLAGGN